jgi:hypothetical protein
MTLAQLESLTGARVADLTESAPGFVA